MRTLENRSEHQIQVTDDGEVEVISWSDETRLIYEHGLEGVIHEKNEVLQLFVDEDKPTVEVAPALEDDNVEFWLSVGELEMPIRKQDRLGLMEALAEVYGADEKKVGPFYNLIEEAMDTEVEKSTADKFLPIVERIAPDEATIETEADGWFINDHLLLTYDLELQHPGVSDEIRHGSMENDETAYKLDVGKKSGQMELGSLSYGAMTEALIEFVTKAVWAVKFAPAQQ